jgi:hypothetical protein
VASQRVSAVYRSKFFEGTGSDWSTLAFSRGSSATSIVAGPRFHAHAVERETRAIDVRSRFEIVDRASEIPGPRGPALARHWPRLPIRQHAEILMIWQFATDTRSVMSHAIVRVVVSGPPIPTAGGDFSSHRHVAGLAGSASCTDGGFRHISGPAVSPRWRDSETLPPLGGVVRKHWEFEEVGCGGLQPAVLAAVERGGIAHPMPPSVP